MSLLPASQPLSGCDVEIEPFEGEFFHVQFTFGPNVVEDRIVEMSADNTKIKRYFTDKSFGFRAANRDVDENDPPNKIVLENQETRLLTELHRVVHH